METNKNKFGNIDKENEINIDNTIECNINLSKSQSEDLCNIDTCTNSENITPSKVESGNTNKKYTRSYSDDHEYKNKLKLIFFVSLKK